MILNVSVLSQTCETQTCPDFALNGCKHAVCMRYRNNPNLECKYVLNITGVIGTKKYTKSFVLNETLSLL